MCVGRQSYILTGNNTLYTCDTARVEAQSSTMVVKNWVSPDPSPPDRRANSYHTHSPHHRTQRRFEEVERPQCAGNERGDEREGLTRCCCRLPPKSSRTIRDISAPLSQQWRVENEEFVYSLNSSWDTAVILRVVAYIPPSPPSGLSIITWHTSKPK